MCTLACACNWFFDWHPEYEGPYNIGKFYIKNQTSAYLKFIFPYHTEAKEIYLNPQDSICIITQKNIPEDKPQFDYILEMKTEISKIKIYLTFTEIVYGQVWEECDIFNEKHHFYLETAWHKYENLSSNVNTTWVFDISDEDIEEK